MVFAKFRKSDLSRLAFIIGAREITYEQFSKHIAHIRSIFEAELSNDPVVGLSIRLSTYQHWVAHFAAASLGIATVAMRPDQSTYKDVPAVGPVDPMQDARLIVLNAEIMKGAQEEKTKGAALKHLATFLEKNPDLLHRIVLTSGSTGSARDVMLSNDMLSKRVERQNEWFASFSSNKPSERKSLNLMGRDTEGGFSGPMGRLLMRETCVFIGGGNGAAAIEDAVGASNLIGGSPAFFAGLVATGKKYPDHETREIISVGARLEGALVEKIRDALAAKIINGYGSTEVGIVASHEQTGEMDDSSYVGQLYPGTQVEICSAADDVLPFGEEGKIRVKTPVMVDSYGQAHSEGAFKDGWFYPGDIGRLTEDGGLFVVGRDDDLLSVNGDKLLASELESKLIESSHFDDVCVLAVNNKDHQQFLLIMTVTELQRKAQRMEIKKHIPFVPFRVVPVKQIPRNHMGKIERRALTEYAQGLVDRQAAEGNVADSE